MVAAPVIIAGYKEKDTIIKAVIYGIAAIAVIYALWKLFGKFKSIGGKIDKALEGVKESIEELGEYGLTKPVTPDDTAEIIRKRAKGKDTYYVEKLIYDALKEQGKELPENVTPVINVPKTSTVEKYDKSPTIGTWTGIGSIGAYVRAVEEERSKVPVKNISMEEYAELQAKRWEAIAAKTSPKEYLPQAHGAKPIPSPIGGSPAARGLIPVGENMYIDVRTGKTVKLPGLVKEPPHVLPIRRQLEVL